MKIGFVGKGGSGKSTLSWLVARSLAASGRKVLAIDADQNADLAHNLGVEDVASLPWLSGAAAAVHGRFRLPENAKLLDVLEADENVRFTTEPLDPVIEPYARAVSPGIFLVALGQHRDEHLWSGRCSHASAKPAKILLAYLDEAEPWDVIVDSPAGTDMATYGLHLGLDAIVCAVESTRNSQDVARQVAKVAGAFGIPCFSVWTKASPEDESPTVEGAPLIGQVPFERAVGSANWESVSSEAKAAAQNVTDALRRQVARADGRARLHAWRAAHRSFVDAR